MLNILNVQMFSPTSMAWMYCTSDDGVPCRSYPYWPQHTAFIMITNCAETKGKGLLKRHCSSLKFSLRYKEQFRILTYNLIKGFEVQDSEGR